MLLYTSSNNTDGSPVLVIFHVLRLELQINGGRDPGIRGRTDDTTGRNILVALGDVLQVGHSADTRSSRTWHRRIALRVLDLLHEVGGDQARLPRLELGHVETIAVHVTKYEQVVTQRYGQLLCACVRVRACVCVCVCVCVQV